MTGAKRTADNGRRTNKERFSLTLAGIANRGLIFDVWKAIPQVAWTKERPAPSDSARNPSNSAKGASSRSLTSFTAPFDIESRADVLRRRRLLINLSYIIYLLIFFFISDGLIREIACENVYRESGSHEITWVYSSSCGFSITIVIEAAGPVSNCRCA
jgi:hypothetical protein